MIYVWCNIVLYAGDIGSDRVSPRQVSVHIASIHLYFHFIYLSPDVQFFTLKYN